MRWIEEYNESEDSGNKKKSVGSLTFVILDLSGELSVDVFSFVLVSLEILLNVLVITLFSCECNRYEWSVVFRRFEEGVGEAELGGKSKNKNEN